MTNGWTLMGHFLERYGYGNAVIELGQRMGPEVTRLDMAQQAEVDEETGERQFPMLDFQEWHWEVPGQVVCLAIPPWYPFVECHDLVGFTMCESTEVPREFVGPLRERASRVIVPCEHCREVYEQTVDVPVSVVPLGIDPEMYPVMERERREERPYTFLWSGTPDLRKGYDLVYRAFWEAFRGSLDVRLVMHFRAFPAGLKGVRDKNVRLVEGLIPQDDWLGLLREADCFVYPARGEGWGLPPREAACTGLPVIATRWSGMREGIEHWALPLGVERLVSASFGPWDPGDIGVWAEPDFEQLKASMSRCYNNQETARAFGARAARWLREHQTWAHSARALREVMGG